MNFFFSENTTPQKKKKKNLSGSLKVTYLTRSYQSTKTLLRYLLRKKRFYKIVVKIEETEGEVLF